MRHSFERKNIDDLAEARDAGSILSNGAEREIKDVRLDIVVPKGYNIKVLNKVKEYGEKKLGKGKVNIFEAE